MNEPTIAQDIFCQDCGYNLRGLTGDRCPECGRSLAGLRTDVSQIPWVHRKEIGRFLAYWKTVWFVMFRQRQFCDEMVRPVSYSDSQKFRWLTVLLACLPFVVAEMILQIQQTESPMDFPLFNVFWNNFGFGLSAYAGIFLFIAAASGLPSYFFESKKVETQVRNRGIALSYYACGPLSFLFVPIVAVLIWLNIGLNDAVGIIAVFFASIPPLLVFLIWWLDLIHIARRLIPDNPTGAVVVALGLPLFWFFLFHLTVVLVPLLTLYTAVIFSSLT